MKEPVLERSMSFKLLSTFSNENVFCISLSCVFKDCLFVVDKDTYRGWNGCPSHLWQCSCILNKFFFSVCVFSSCFTFSSDCKAALKSSFNKFSRHSSMLGCDFALVSSEPISKEKIENQQIACFVNCQDASVFALVRGFHGRLDHTRQE
eukprot:Lithocolla_globosa_v1_NODE_581_length_3686_cov_8.608097.p3 type:complete len:150 gc:universal NODE_581_length_3686_cov_8.608097:2608-2159(-)